MQLLGHDSLLLHTAVVLQRQNKRIWRGLENKHMFKYACVFICLIYVFIFVLEKEKGKPLGIMTRAVTRRMKITGAKLASKRLFRVDVQIVQITMFKSLKQRL